MIGRPVFLVQQVLYDRSFSSKIGSLRILSHLHMAFLLGDVIGWGARGRIPGRTAEVLGA